MSRSAAEPLRPLTEEECKELQRVSRASSECRIRHQRAVALLATAQGKSLSEAARLVGWKSHDPVTKVTRRFNQVGLGALDDLPRTGPRRTSGPAAQARILQEANRTPDLKRRCDRNLVTRALAACAASCSGWVAQGQHLYHSADAARSRLYLAEEPHLVSYGPNPQKREGWDGLPE